MNRTVFSTRIARTGLTALDDECRRLEISRTSAVRSAVQLWLDTPASQRPDDPDARVDGRTAQGRAAKIEAEVARRVDAELRKLRLVSEGER